MTQTSTLYQFEIYRDGEKIGDVQLEPGQHKIGSHPRSALFIDDPGVSRVHALVEPGEGGGAVVMDLGSGRGTLVNGARINKHSLANGDRIGVGGVELVYKLLIAGGQQRSRGARSAAAAARIPDAVAYSRRYLARPAKTDGSLEIAILARDYVLVDDTFKPPTDIRVGSDFNSKPVLGKKDKANEIFFTLDDPLLGRNFTLVDCSSGKPVLRYPVGAQGEVYVGSERFTLDEAATNGTAKVSANVASIPLNDDVRARLSFGPITIFVHRSTSMKVLAGSRRFNFRTLIPFAISAFLHLSFLGLSMWYPTNLGNYSSDAMNRNDRWVQIVSQAVIEEEPEVPEYLDEQEDSGDEAPAETGEAGRSGEETAEETDRRSSSTNTGEVSELARQQALDTAQNLGALSALNAMGPSSMFGSGADAYADVEAIGGISGDAVGASYGMGGLAAYGGGMSTGAVAGGGGFGGGPIGLRGRGGDGAASSLRGVSERGERQVAVRPGTPEVEGQLDREIIRRVIAQHRREIVACYESELQRSPDLAGRVAVSFVIDPSGSVARASVASSTLGSSTVEECIVARVRRWRFPEPRGGGIVRVNYPFTFTSG